jgi:hypothetical protein
VIYFSFFILPAIADTEVRSVGNTIKNTAGRLRRPVFF